MKSHLLSCWREYFDSTFTYCAHCAKQAVAFSMHSQNLCCGCQAASTSVSGSGSGSGSCFSAGSAGSVSAFALCSHCGLFGTVPFSSGRPQCVVMLILLLSAAMQSVTALTLPVPVTGVSQDGREWDRICGSGTESKQTNQLAD